MTQEEVITLMESSQTEEEWNANCAKVKAACDGYPPFWHQEIIQSGLAEKIAARWGGDAQIHVMMI